ncbi:hypothetical protein NLG97_g3068 [Lecanicillium saksenae]|uniref:Uncharacterized protein n=1 Tax=Lecanicillium saksenae TaxID=468837 RepID=A0ACC1QZ42_9HYPO|nr:hypothetical protein NLG97_g3068 [Lecanicillium saksenae]
MAMVTTKVPTGFLARWCLADSWDFTSERYECARENQTQSDYWTVCCDGDIVNVKTNIWRIPNMTMEDLVCCRHIGSLEGGIHPLPTGPPWTCDLGAVGTPLASLAATNTDNAGAFVATYASANYEFGPTPTDLLLTETPQCLWVYTKESATMTEVTVDAASIVRLSTTTFIGGPDQSDEDPATVVTTPFWTHSSSTSGSPPSSSITTPPSKSSSEGQETVHSTSSSGGNLGQPVQLSTSIPHFIVLALLIQFLL